MLTAQAIALMTACILDLIFGDPDFPLHPIRLMGGLISVTEKIMRKIFPENKVGETAGGILMAVIVICVSGGIPFAALYFAYRFNIFLGVFLEAVICYFMLSAKSLAKAGKRVYSALIRQDTEEARDMVSMIVGRDTEMLDDEGITKAAVETVAENTSDGVVAPLIYMALGGAVLGCMYKAVNTMDSMAGYKNDKYIYFGRFAAKLDDAVNFIPSRIAARFMIIASYVLGFDGGNASYIHKRDCRKHASPNSAQTESVVAGALCIQLAGDAYYFGKLCKKPYIGDPIRDVQFSNILQTNRLMYFTSAVTAVILIAAKLVLGHFVSVGW